MSQPRRANPTSPARRNTPDRDPPGLAARRVAVALVEQALAGRQLDFALDGEAGEMGLGALDERDRGLVRAIVGTALRRHGQIEDALSRLMSRPLPQKAVHIRAVLAVAAAQVLFLDVPDHAAVSLAVTLAGADRRSARWSGLVNGVMRRLGRERDTILAAQDAASLALPAWLAPRWRRAYGDATARAIGEAILSEPALDLTVREDAAGWAERLGGVVLPTGGVRLVAHGPIERLPGFAEGAWWVQDAAASLPARLLGAVAGKRVADLCAAPGGKTAMLAAAGGMVTAVDLSASRAERLGGNLARLGLSAEIVVADLLEWAPAQRFPAILLDAPCTATGTLRRHPDAAFAKDERDVAALAALQARLLERAVEWLEPGGVIVYSTCSLEPEEGEAQVTRLLAAGAPVERVPVDPAEIGGLAEAVSDSGDLRTLPCHLPATDPRLAGLDGFFATRLRRTG